jgi:hypothetical protein
MSSILEFLKRMYEDAYDLPNFYLGIEDELYCHVFTIFFLIALLFSFLLLLKIILGRRETRKEDIKRTKRIEKSILGVLESKDKNKKEKNI